MIENGMVVGADREYDDSLKKWEKSRPSCDCCGEIIADDKCIQLGEYLYHEECFKSFFRQNFPIEFRFMAEQIQEELDYSADIRVDTPSIEEV